MVSLVKKHCVYNYSTEKEARLTGHFKMTVPITHDMSPDAQLLVYYMRDDGEIIASAVKFNIEKCFKNKVRVLVHVLH